MKGLRTASAGGQTLLGLAVVLAPLTAIVLAVAGAGRLVADQTRLQAAADAAAYSAAAREAEALNATAIGNRTLVAHLATTAQVTALVSHVRALDRLAAVAAAAGLALPPLAPLAGAFGRAADAAVAAATSLARGVVPLARVQDSLASAAAAAALLKADTDLARLAEGVLTANAPGARFSPESRLALRSGPLARSVVPASGRQLLEVATASLDRFTAGRDGRPPFGRTWRLAGAGKSGVSRLRDGRGPEASDRIGVDLPGGRRVGFETTARADEFGHRRVAAGWVLRRGESPAPVRLEASVESWGGRRLTAKAAAAAVYRRPGRPAERPSLFGPFWRPRLVPFATRPGNQKIGHGALQGWTR